MQQQVSNSMPLLFRLHLRGRECMQTATCAHHFFFQKSKHFLNTFLSSKTWTKIFRYSNDTKFMVFSLILYFPYNNLACTAFHLSILNWAHYFNGTVLLKVTGFVDGHAKANRWSDTFGGPYKYNTWRYINFYSLPTCSMFICFQLLTKLYWKESYPIGVGATR